MKKRDLALASQTPRISGWRSWSINRDKLKVESHRDRLKELECIARSMALSFKEIGMETMVDRYRLVKRYLKSDRLSNDRRDPVDG